MKKFFHLLLFSIPAFANNAPHQELPPTYGPQSEQEDPFLKAANKAKSTPQEFSPEMRKVVMDSAPQRLKEIIATFNDKNSTEEIREHRFILHGPPGSGKTTLAQVFAQEINRSCIFISAAHLSNEYQDSTLQNLERIMEEAAKKPSVVVIDEINLIINTPKNNQNGDTPNKIWCVLDRYAQNSNIILIGTTNNIKSLEAPVKDRFARRLIEVSLISSPEMKKKIILLYLGKSNQCEDAYLSFLAEKSKEFSIRAIKEMVNIAKRSAYHRTPTSALVIQSDLEEAFKGIKESEAASSDKKTFFESTRETCGKWCWQVTTGSASLVLGGCASKLLPNIFSSATPATAPIAKNIKLQANPVIQKMAAQTPATLNHIAATISPKAVLDFFQKIRLPI